MWFNQIANNNELLIKTGTYAGISGIAIFNIDCSRRYFLEKRWKQGSNIFTAIMMNPSNAAHNKSDDTVDQIIELAKDQCCDALYVVNVSSIIDGSSSNLKSSQFNYDSLNWLFITRAISESSFVFIGWGLKGHQGILKQQKSNPIILSTFKDVLSKIYCYEVIKSSDKKYIKKPMYYVPHPRPLYDKDRYSNTKIKKINEYEFSRLFNW